MKTSKKSTFDDTFAYIYCRNGNNGVKAYEEASELWGKKVGTYNSMANKASVLIKKGKIQEIIAQHQIELKLEISEKFMEERQKIINAMWTTYSKSMEEQTAFDRNGKELDAYTVNSISGANKSLELLAKATGMLVDKVETTNENNNSFNVIEIELS